jgi:hypothetical protein
MDRDQTISVEDMHTQMKAVTAELLAPFEAVGGQAAVAAPWSGQGEITIAHSLCLADLQEWKPKPIAWTRLGWFAEFGSNIIAAASGAGKSFKLEDEAIHLAGQGYRVLILSGDKGFASVAERLKCMLDGRGAATLPGDLQLVDVQGLDLASAEGCDALSGLLDERGADALILDMLGTYAHLREWGSTAEPALLMSRLRMLAERLRGGLYLGVRCRKPKDFTKDKLIDSVKDSVEIVGGADSIAVITTTGDEDAKVRTLRHAKCSFHREAAPLNFKILGDVPGPVRVIYEEAREASSQRLEEAKAAAIRVVKESKIPLYKTALADKLGIDHNLGVQAVEALLQEGRLGYVSPGKRSPVVLREREYVQEERNDLF